MRRVLDLVVMNAGINGWPLSALPLEETVTALCGDGVDVSVARHVIMIFSSTPPPADGDATMSQAEVALDARRVCTEKAAALLEKQPMWRLDEFMIAWTSTCPEGMPPQQDMLRGLALLDPQGADFTVSAFLASELAPKPKDRFAMLFRRKERWTRAELEPYLQHVEEAGASIDALLLTWCRRSQGSASEPEIYTQRHAA
jgi:Sister chromatid cohesion protein Dcc1